MWDQEVWSLHEGIPRDLREQVVWRLCQGGMAELFRGGTIEVINRVFLAGVDCGRKSTNQSVGHSPDCRTGV